MPVPRYTVASGAILQAVISSQKDGVTILNVSHWKLTGAPAPQDGILTMVAFDSLFNINGGYVDKYTAVQPEGTTTTFVSYQWIFPVRYAYRTFTPISLAGKVVGASLPANVCLAVERKNDTAGKVNRGEMHIGPVPASFVAGSVKLVAADTAYAPFLTECVAELSDLANTFAPVLFHKLAPAQSAQPNFAQLLRTSRALHRRTVGVGI